MSDLLELEGEHTVIAPSVCRSLRPSVKNIALGSGLKNSLTLDYQTSCTDSS